MFPKQTPLQQWALNEFQSYTEAANPVVRAWIPDHSSLLALLLHSSAQAEVLETAIIHLISVYSVTRAQLSQTGLYSRTGDEEDGFPQSCYCSCKPNSVFPEILLSTLLIYNSSLISNTVAMLEAVWLSVSFLWLLNHSSASSF